MHTTLQPKTNIKLLAIWGTITVVVVMVAFPVPWSMLVVGAALGACAGVIQLRSLRDSATLLLRAQTAMDVRRALSSSRTGRIYLYAFWGSMLILFAAAVYLLRDRAFVGLIASYSAFAFMRELVTLRGAYELHKISMEL